MNTQDIQNLKLLEQRLLWLACWMIHNANHLRDKSDGLKVGGHQASCASIVSIMTALYFHTLKAQDRVAVKPHASPVFHAMQYLMGNQTLEKIRGQYVTRYHYRAGEMWKIEELLDGDLISLEEF